MDENKLDCCRPACLFKLLRDSRTYSRDYQKIRAIIMLFRGIMDFSERTTSPNDARHQPSFLFMYDFVADLPWIIVFTSSFYKKLPKRAYFCFLLPRY
jgi:hypothetical protein